MTDSSYTHYAILVDRSGSMGSIAKETETGIAEYIREQARLDGKATISLYEFDAWQPQPGRHAAQDGRLATQVNAVYNFAPIGIMLPPYRLVPRGFTPLLDAVGLTVTETGEKLAALPGDERPGLVIFVIVTDGGENYSQEWTRERVKSLTQQQERDYGWRFTYLGANQDAFSEAAAMGMNVNSAMNYAASSSGTRNAWGSAGKWSARTRHAGPGGQSVSYSSAEREASAEEDSK